MVTMNSDTNMMLLIMQFNLYYYHKNLTIFQIKWKSSLFTKYDYFIGEARETEEGAEHHDSISIDAQNHNTKQIN